MVKISRRAYAHQAFPKVLLEYSACQQYAGSMIFLALPQAPVTFIRLES